MSISLAKEEVSTVVNSRRILREKGIDPNTDVKTLCRKAGISRKTGYKWANEQVVSDLVERINALEADLSRACEKSVAAEKEHADLRFRLECREAAWEIHGVEELLSKKKDIRKRKSAKQ